jgi:hypothetical protein
MKSRFELALKSLGGRFKPQDKDLMANSKKVREHIKAGKGVCKDLINDILFTKPIVTDKLITYCDNLVNDKVVLPIPFRGTPAALAYEDAYSVRYAPDVKKVPGCYRVFDESTHRSYVGQSLQVGARLSTHVGLDRTRTPIGDWMSELNYENRGLVELYLVPIQNNYHGLTLREFLCVMEMYLFLVYKPSENRILVSTPGKMRVPTKVTKK